MFVGIPLLYYTIANIFVTLFNKVLIQLINERKDWFLDELVSEMARRTSKVVSIPTLWRSLEICGITKKKVCINIICMSIIFLFEYLVITILFLNNKLEKAAKERSEILRANYILTIGTHYNPNQLIFLDESSKDERTLSRQYGYSLKNTRAIQKVVFLRGTRYTILPALSLDGILAVDIMVSSCNKERFCNFILTQVVSIYFI
jgi:hypothetical protein